MPDPIYKPLARIKDNTNNVVFLIKATGLENSKTITLTSDVTGSSTFDLTDNIQIACTISNGAVNHDKLATDSVQNDKILAGTIALDKLAQACFGNSDVATDNDGHIATHAQVVAYVTRLLQGYGQNYGVMSVASINAMTLDNLHNGDLVIVGGIDEEHPANTITLGNLTVRNGENLIFHKEGSGASVTGVWQSIDGEFKLIQTAVDTDSQTGSGKGGVARTLTRLQQNSNGDIVATFSDIVIASSQVTDKMSTYDGTGSDKTKLVTGEAVKAALDTLDAEVTSSDGTNVQVKVTEANGKITAVNVTTDNTEDRNNKVSAFQTTPDNTHYPSEKLVKDSLDGKADKVSNATNGHLAGLDANGNLTDSGKTSSDFSDVHHGHGNITEDGLILSNSTSQAAVSRECALVYTDQTNKIKKTDVKFDAASDYKALTQKGTFEEIVKDVKLNGASTALAKINGVVTIPDAVPTGSTGETNGLMTAADKSKLNNISANATHVSSSQTNGNIKIDDVETTVYTHPSNGANTSKGDTANQTPGFGDTFKAVSATVDSAGHTTALADHTVKIPDTVAAPYESDQSPGNDGLMSAQDKKKLDDLSSGAALSDKFETIAEALNELDARQSATENAVNEENLGERIFDSVDTQVLKIGGENVEPGTATPQDVDSSASVGTSTNFAREDHKHKIVVVTGDSDGQVKVAGQNVTVKGFSDVKTKAGSAIQGVNVNGTALTPDANNVVSIPTASDSQHGTALFMSSQEAALLWSTAWDDASAT